MQATYQANLPQNHAAFVHPLAMTLRGVSQDFYAPCDVAVCVAAVMLDNHSDYARLASIPLPQVNGLELLSDTHIGPAVAVDESLTPYAGFKTLGVDVETPAYIPYPVALSPSAVEEIGDLFVEGCIELDAVATYIPRKGAFCKAKVLIRKVIRVGLFA